MKRTRKSKKEPGIVKTEIVKETIRTQKCEEPRLAVIFTTKKIIKT